MINVGDYSAVVNFKPSDLTKVDEELQSLFKYQVLQDISQNIAVELMHNEKWFTLNHEQTILFLYLKKKFGEKVQISDSEGNEVHPTPKTVLSIIEKCNQNISIDLCEELGLTTQAIRFSEDSKIKSMFF